MNSIAVFRLTIFGSWLITLLVTIAVYVTRFAIQGQDPDLESSMNTVMGILLPQVGIMVAFFFASDRLDQRRLLKEERGLALLAMALSLIYHVTFISLLLLLIGLRSFEMTMPAKTAVFLKFVGYLSIVGMSPVAYLFAKAHHGKQPRQPASGDAGAVAAPPSGPVR